jgi:hypothetical protein
MPAKTVALLLVVLAASPLTVPFRGLDSGGAHDRLAQEHATTAAVLWLSEAGFVAGAFGSSGLPDDPADDVGQADAWCGEIRLIHATAAQMPTGMCFEAARQRGVPRERRRQSPSTRFLGVLRL